MKILLFGGTFDPIHRGHTKVAMHAAEQIGTEKIVFVPARRSPHKKFFSVASGVERLEMITLAIVGMDKFEVSDCELKRAQPSYTLDTVREFQAQYRDKAKISWLVGADMVKDLPKWYKINDLIDECNLSVMLRAGFEYPDFDEFEGVFGRQRVEKLKQNVISTPLIDISSTEIRRKLACGADVGDLVEMKVLNYIKTKELYGS